MSTKLSRYCESLMEAAWIAALVLIPVFFNIYSSRIFEPDKVAVLRSLALLILGAWIVKSINEGGPRWEYLKQDSSVVKFIIKFPLLGAVTGFALLYLISTLFSVAPRASFWGSYQRLQGTYTTLSYLVVFAAILGNLRRRAQVDRLITTAVLASLPIVLYGFLQHYQRDPVPWAGDTSIRIAANMGNSIFVAAYLIMVFPLTIGRIVQSFTAILKDETHLWSRVAAATVYVFIAASQLIALYMSQSRGPMLGLLAGSFFLFLLLSLYWRKRWLTVSTVSASIALGIFLIVFNIQGGPLESLRKLPAIGRFGMLLDPGSNTALVRKYIWQGAADLVGLHAPLEYPDGSKDAYNFLRPIIGYGPESMYVAYNPFYVPELAIVERRNASPDRSHNETWDSLVITGVMGIIVYLLIFTLIFYYGLRWIGLITGKRQIKYFLLLWMGSGTAGAFGMSFWRGIEYFGVGLPFGMLIGLLIYLTLVAITGSYRSPETPADASRHLILILLIAAIVAHFVEINFGIAIVSTRLYFWVYAALIVVVGYVLPQVKGSEILDPMLNLDNISVDAIKHAATGASTKKKRRGRGSASAGDSSWVLENRGALISACGIALLLITLNYNFISNSRGLTSTTEIIWSALTQLARLQGERSYGVLLMYLTTWLFMGMVLCAEQGAPDVKSWWRGLAITLGGSMLLAVLYAFWHAGTLAAMARNTATTIEGVLTQVGRFEGLLAKFYLTVAIVLIIFARVLSERESQRMGESKLAGLIASPIILILVIALAAFTNLRIIQADIVYKIAEPFSQSRQWPVAITVYNRANLLAPNEDYYYLFLGRAFLEHAKTLQDSAQRDRFIEEARDELVKAQRLNPLNTDHTANIARLYSLWASFAEDPTLKLERAQTSSEYFSKAVNLSRNSALLWGEWAYLLLTVLQQPDQAYQNISRAIEIDPQFHRSYALLGEYYLRQSSNASDESSREAAYELAAAGFEKALELPAPGEPMAKFNYAQMLGNIEAELGRYPEALEAYQIALENLPAGGEVWRVQEAIAGLYVRQGDLSSASLYIQDAINGAPNDQRERLIALLAQLQQSEQP